jgi:hypothetical protein
LIFPEKTALFKNKFVYLQGSGTEHLHCYIGNLSDDMTLLKLAKIRINFCRHQNAAITAGGFIEMMWAHFSINELEKRRRKNRDSDEERQKIDEEIEKIALKARNGKLKTNLPQISSEFPVRTGHPSHVDARRDRRRRRMALSIPNRPQTDVAT